MKKIKLSYLWINAILILGFNMTFADELWLPSIFSEKMVLQRQMPIPIWGKASKGAEVNVKLLKDTDLTQVLAEQTAIADSESGRWRVDLPAVSTQKRCGLLVEAKDAEGNIERRAFYDVMVGEVWITCGQSNCIMPIEDCDDYESALASRNDYPLLRAIGIGMRGTHENTEAQEECYGYWGLSTWHDQNWQITKSSKKDLSGGSQGLSYFFSRELQDSLGKEIPIGMVNVGAILPVETWVSPEEVDRRKELHSLKNKAYPHATSRGYLTNIAPLAPFAVRGVIYYQGEMNAGRCNDYYYGLKGLIASWRKVWERKDLPFFVVQLPGFIKHLNKERHALDMDEDAVAAAGGLNNNHSWPYIREAQMDIAEEDEYVETVVTIDLGSRYDIHPKRKLPVAKRLALKTRRAVYGEKNLIADSPLPFSFKALKDGFEIAFKGAGDGLVGKDTLNGFELLGKDGVWIPAAAKIQDNRVIVTAATDDGFTGVRYAWRGYPEVSLYNSAGLPATPFMYPRSDLSSAQSRRKK
jgi:sialate O-acetylesterase